jgi:hypothetical protein
VSSYSTTSWLAITGEAFAVTFATFLREDRAFMVTRAFVIGLFPPLCFARISLIPATAKTLRAEPQAIRPVPFEAG